MKDYLHKFLRFALIAVILPGGVQALAQDVLLASVKQQAWSQTNPSKQSAGMTLAEALKQIGLKYQIKFGYDEEVVDGKILKYNEIPEGKINEILTIILSPLRLVHEQLDDQHYVIVPEHAKKKTFKKLKKRVLDSGGTGNLNPDIRNTARQNMLLMRSQPPDSVITGNVTDENGKGLPGVNIIVKGTSYGTITDIEGNYILAVQDQPATLVFTFVGYLTKEVETGSRQVIDVTMSLDVTTLSEVLVIGYGEVERKDITGSVASVKEEDLKSMPMTTLEQGLQGRAAGVQVTQADASPGGAISLRIRGGNSINFSNEPLYVVDGYPTFNVQSINPNDILSMEILKDASATAIYGARGANGVVIITTKQGTTGQSRLDFEFFTGWQDITRTIPVLNGTQYAELANEAFIQDGRPAPFPNPEELGEGTDWQDEIFRTAPISNYQLSFSKGTDKTRFAITGNYFKQEGIVINSQFERISTRFNLESDINDKLRIGNNLTLNYLDNNAVLVNSGGRGSAGVVHNALTATPDLPIFNDDGSYFINVQQVGPGFRRDNPVALAEEVTNQTLTGRILGNFFVEYEMLEGLTAKVSLGADVRHEKLNRYIPSNTFRGFFENGIGRVRTRQIYNWLNENTLTYRKSSGNHSLDAVVGITLQKENLEENNSEAQGFVNDILGFNSLESASVPLPSSTRAEQWSLLSYLGRVNYTFKDKYLFTLSARIDGSSRFGENNEFGFFPSGAFGWRLSEESFVQSLNLFSDLKLRASYGVTGFQEIGLYRSQNRLGTTNYVLGDELAIGIAPNRVGNPDLQWERTNQFDVGLDMAFFNNRLRFTMDYYYKRTRDLLLNVNLPWTSGFNFATRNVGEVENKGFEIAVGADILTNELKWTVDANYSMNRNQVLDLGGTGEFFGPTSGFTGFYTPGPAMIIREGEPVNAFFGFVGDGLFRTQEDIDNGPQHRFMELGDLRFRDLNNDNVIDDEDRTVIGNAQPDFIFGITNTLAYKNFDLNVFIQGVVGNDVLNAYRLYELESMRGVHNNLADVVDRWTPENPDAAFPKADRRGQERFVSTRGIEDGSYVRLRNVVLGYTLPVDNISWLSSARFYVSGQNLVTITDYTGYDPEVNSFGTQPINQGIDYGAYPRARTYMVGVNIGF